MSDTVEVIVGIVGRPHGIKGEVGIELRTDEPERRFAPGSILRPEGGGRVLTVESARDHSGRLLVRFRECADRTAVERIRGTVLVVDVVDGERPGRRRGVLRPPARRSAGARRRRRRGRPGRPRRPPARAGPAGIRTPAGVRLVPFVRALVPEVDLAAGTVRLADVPGLLTDLDDTAQSESDT